MKLTFKYLPGFSLVELMVTLTIVAIITAVAIPSLNKYIQRSKVADIINSAQVYQNLVNQNISSLESVTDSGTGITVPSTFPTNIGNVIISSDGVISIHTNITPGGLVVNLIFTPSYDSTNELITWSCAIDDARVNDYVPSDCRI